MIFKFVNLSSKRSCLMLDCAAERVKARIELIDKVLTCFCGEVRKFFFYLTANFVLKQPFISFIYAKVDEPSKPDQEFATAAMVARLQCTVAKRRSSYRRVTSNSACNICASTDVVFGG